MLGISRRKTPKARQDMESKGVGRGGQRGVRLLSGCCDWYPHSLDGASSAAHVSLRDGSQVRERLFQDGGLEALSCEFHVCHLSLCRAGMLLDLLLLCPVANVRVGPQQIHKKPLPSVKVMEAADAR